MRQGGAKRFRKAGLARERISAWPPGGQDEEVFFIALQAGEEARFQEARLACAGGGRNRQDALRRAAPHLAERIEPRRDLRIAAEEDGGVFLFEGFQAAIGRAAFGEAEVFRVEACALQAEAEAREAVFAQFGRRDVRHLELRGELQRQLAPGGWLDEDGEDLLAEGLGELELVEAPFGGAPVWRDKHDDREAALARLLQLLFPALARGEAMFGIKVEEGLAIAFGPQPVAYGDRLCVVFARMADEYHAHSIGPSTGRGSSQKLSGGKRGGASGAEQVQQDAAKFLRF